MSVGAPCVRVPTWSSPSVTSHLAAVKSHMSSTARNGEKVLPGSRRAASRLSLDREKASSNSTGSLIGMQPADVDAENALPASRSVNMADVAPCPEGEVPSQDTVNKRPASGKVNALSSIKLEIPDKQESFQAKPPRLVSVLTLQDTAEEHEKESTISPSDEMADATGDEAHPSPTLDKKKMKRFRLTHNQTRFLMSEFTRQAHPDAAHRQRLSREIPGLTPRQVQVWFQNRRAKLKRLTTNDRERMLKSRALPDDFDTTKVLRTPFENKSTTGTPVISPQEYGAPNLDFSGLRALRTDYLERPNEDDYLISPASTAGTYFSPTTQGRSDGMPQASWAFGRPTASASMTDLQRTTRNDYPVNRSSSLSDASTHPPPFHPSFQMHNRFAATTAQAAQPGMSYARTPMDYGVPQRPSGMVTAYDQHHSCEDSVSPTDSQGTYDMKTMGSQQSYQPRQMPQDFNALGMSSQIQPSGRQMSSMQTYPSQDYRHFSYDEASGSLGTAIPYTQANASSLSLPASFSSTESGTLVHDSMHQSSGTVDPSRTKFGNPSFSYPKYLQQ